MFGLQFKTFLKCGIHPKFSWMKFSFSDSYLSSKVYKNNNDFSHFYPFTISISVNMHRTRPPLLNNSSLVADTRFSAEKPETLVSLFMCCLLSPPSNHHCSGCHTEISKGSLWHSRRNDLFSFHFLKHSKTNKPHSSIVNLTGRPERLRRWSN